MAALNSIVPGYQREGSFIVVNFNVAVIHVSYVSDDLSLASLDGAYVIFPIISCNGLCPMAAKHATSVV